VHADTRRARYDGRQEFRFLTTVERPDGNEILVTTRWQAYLRNGNPVRHYRDSDNYMGGAGYTDRGYQNAIVSSGIPRAPVPRIWRPSVDLGHRSDARPSTLHVVSVDPDFHMGRRGRVVRRGAGEYEDASRSTRAGSETASTSSSCASTRGARVEPPARSRVHS
jgi:hypothetical protein